MPVSGRPRRRRPADAGAAEEARRAGRRRVGRAGAASAQRDGKAEALFLDSVVPRRDAGRGPAEGARRGARQAADPQGHEYQLADGWTSVNFVRPAHGLVALHGADVVPVARARPATPAADARPSLRGAGRPGRCCATPTATRASCDDAGRGDRQLRRAPRRDRAPARTPRPRRQGLTPIDDDALLDEVTALVERPNVLVCQFEREFLDVPQECLILTMKANQKYFPLLDAARPADEPVPGRQQHPPGRPERA